MEDAQIIDLYFSRDEQAIVETDGKYGGYCRTLAGNILTLRQDAEEVVNDTWLHAWNAMPPERPLRLKSWLGRIVRNLALDRWRRDHAAKRLSGMDVMLSELDDCVPDRVSVEAAYDARELGDGVNDWLRSLPEDDRALFLQRYWYGEAVNALAAQTGRTAQQTAKRLYTLRQKLKAYLEQEGIAV